MDELVKPFRALADETRLRMLSIVARKECCVCEVMQVLDISQTRASRNLKILEEAGFLKSRRKGAWVYYSTDGDPPTGLAGALATLTGEFTDKYPVFRKDLESLKKARRLNFSCTENLKQRQKIKKKKNASA